MAHTFVSLLVHLVFSTRHRQNLITPDVEPELFAYISGTLKNLGSLCLEINGTANHLHALYSHNKNMALSDLVMETKKSSSKWIKTNGAILSRFCLAGRLRRFQHRTIRSGDSAALYPESKRKAQA